MHYIKQIKMHQVKLACRMQCSSLQIAGYQQFPVDVFRFYLYIGFRLIPKRAVIALWDVCPEYLESFQGFRVMLIS